MQKTKHNAAVLRSLEDGDVVEFDRGLYSHYGVYVGEEEIVHLAANDENGSMSGSSRSSRSGSSRSSRSGSLFSSAGKISSKAIVKKEHFYTVAGSSKAKKSNKDNKKRPIQRFQIVANALSKIGKRGYNIFTYNCEHFANWCRYKVAFSEQVDRWFIRPLAWLSKKLEVFFTAVQKKLKITPKNDLKAIK